MSVRSSTQPLSAQLLPAAIDNTYSGRRAALWIFALLLLMKLIMSLNTIFNGRNVASNADGIPIDRYPPAAAQTILAMFSIAALAHLMIALAGVLVLIRYRSAVPEGLAALHQHRLRVRLDARVEEPLPDVLHETRASVRGHEHRCQERNGNAAEKTHTLRSTPVQGHENLRSIDSRMNGAKGSGKGDRLVRNGARPPGRLMRPGPSPWFPLPSGERAG
jgi:hypothetical protein